MITSKLHCGKALKFTRKDDAIVGVGRTTIWLHPSASLMFKFVGSLLPALNPL